MYFPVVGDECINLSSQDSVSFSLVKVIQILPVGKIAEKSSF